VRRDLRASLIDGAAYAVMVGAGETYIPAFALALGLGEVTAGLVASLPLLAGSVLQLAAPVVVRAARTQRRGVIVIALLQALCFIPFIIGALHGALGTALLFTVATLYWGAGLGTGPAWNTWIEQLIPRPVRARYFAARNRLAQAATIVALLSAGVILQQGAGRGRALAAFAIAFSIAMAARLVSVRTLAAQSDGRGGTFERPVPVLRFAARLWHGQDGRLVLYMITVQTAVNVAGPYFNPFMLRELHLSYLAYVGLVAAFFTGKIAAMPILGAWAQRYGTHRILWVAGVAIVPMSIVWVPASAYAYLMLIQALSGAAWGGYELATQLLFLESIRREERTSVLTYFNVVNSAALVGGALSGGAILAALPGRFGYHVIFTISFIARLMTLLLLRRVAAAPPRFRRFVDRFVELRPVEGAVSDPIVARIDEPPAPALHPRLRANEEDPTR
jgi:MFS family permease